MKKILSLCFMVITSAMLHATVYSFTTNAGVIKLNDQLGTIYFKGIEYKITDYKDTGSEVNYVFCQHNNTSKMFRFDFSKGNITEHNYIETFKWESVALYNKAKLISGLYKNIPIYIQNNNLTGDKANVFREYTSQLIKGIEDGTVTMRADGSFIDSTGKLSSSGKFDKGLFGRVKNTANNALNLVGDYLYSYIREMPTCDSNWEQVGSPYIILKAEKFE